MINSTNTTLRRDVRNERGSSRLSFIIIVIVIASAGYVAYQLVPLMYNASLYKVYMQDTVDRAIATGKDEAWVREQLIKSAEDYNLPPNPLVETRLSEGRMIVRARWTRPVPLPGYTYEYKFDHTVKSAKFFSSG